MESKNAIYNVSQRGILRMTLLGIQHLFVVIGSILIRSFGSKKILITVILMLLGINTWAQSDKGFKIIENLMIEAVENQKRSPDQFLHCEVNKKATLGDLMAIKKRYDNYYYGTYECQKGSSKNKDKWKLLSFEFIHINDLYDWLNLYVHPFDSLSQELKNLGKGWVHEGEILRKERDQVRNGETNLIPQKQLLNEIYIKWSGELVDGYVDGEGTGVNINEDPKDGNLYGLIIHGKFKKGFPVGKVLVNLYKMEENGAVFDYDLTHTLGDFTNGKAMLTNAKGRQIALIDSKGIGYLIPEDENRYKKYMAEKAFRNYYKNTNLDKTNPGTIKAMEIKYVLYNNPFEIASAAHLPSGQFAGQDNSEVWIDLVTVECRRMVRDITTPCFTSVIRKKNSQLTPSLINRCADALYWRYAAEIYAKENKPGAKELLQWMDVVDGYYLSQNETLLKQILYSRSVIFKLISSPFDNLLNSNYWDVIDKAIESAEKLKETNSYLKERLSQLQTILRNWRDKSLQMRDEAIRYQANKNRDDKESLDAYKASMCDKCKINAKKTTFPLGYSESWSFLFIGEPAESKTNGVIELVNGEKIYWKFIYPENDSAYINISGDYSGDYKTVEEMMESIVKKCKDRYCR